MMGCENNALSHPMLCTILYTVFQKGSGTAGRHSYVMLVVRVLDMFEKAVLRPFARYPMPVIAPNAIRATTRAYSTRS